MASLQPALPKQHYVDPAAFAVERDRVLATSGTAPAGSSELGLGRPGRLAVLDVLGESVLVTSHPRRASSPGTTTSAATGARSCSRPSRTTRCRSVQDAKAIRCPYHSWTYGLDGTLLRAPHTEDVEDFDAASFGLQPRRCRRCGADSCSCTSHLRPRARLLVRRRPGRRSGWSATRSTTSSSARRLTYDVAANWKLVAENYNECYHCAGVHPELCRLVPAFARGGAVAGVGVRDPAPRGRLDVHRVGHLRAGAVRRPRRGRAGPAQGRADLPEPDAVAVRRPRRGVRAVAAGRSTAAGSSASCCSLPTRSRSRRSTPPTPVTSGTS